MPLKPIIDLQVKSAADSDSIFKSLSLTPGSASYEISDKKEVAGRVWTTKVTAKLVHDEELLHEPCILKIQIPGCYITIGTPDLPAQPTVKKEHLVALSLEYKSKTAPPERK